MSLYNGPPRGGTRGGKDQFNWEDVKADKDREYYLGHSVKATTGRWQKGKDVYWYTRDKGQIAEAAQEELRAIKLREEELMAEALGIKPKAVRHVPPAKLNTAEMAQLLSRRSGEEGEGEEAGTPRDPEEVKGLGYAKGGAFAPSEAGHEVLQGAGLGRGGPSGAPGPPAAVPREQLPGPPPITKKALKVLKKAQKKEAKRASKQEMKAMKAARKERRKHKADVRDSAGVGSSPL